MSLARNATASLSPSYERHQPEHSLLSSIEDPKVIEQILKHLKQKAANTDTTNPHTLPPERAPPFTPLTPSLFDPSQTRLFD